MPCSLVTESATESATGSHAPLPQIAILLDISRMVVEESVQKEVDIFVPESR